MSLGSTLEDACQQYVGQALVIEPHNGWGWFHEEGKPFKDSLGVPPPFHLQVVRVYRYKDDLRGILARITDPGFIYDGFWLVSMTRHQGIWNFTDRPANYNILMCPEEPVEGKEEESPDYGKLWPVWHLKGHPQASGYGRIAESLQWCTDYDMKRDAEAKQQAETNGAAEGGSPFRYVGTIVSQHGHDRKT